MSLKRSHDDVVQDDQVAACVEKIKTDKRIRDGIMQNTSLVRQLVAESPRVDIEETIRLGIGSVQVVSTSRSLSTTVAMNELPPYLLVAIKHTFVEEASYGFLTVHFKDANYNYVYDLMKLVEPVKMNEDVLQSILARDAESQKILEKESHNRTEEEMQRIEKRMDEKMEDFIYDEDVSKMLHKLPVETIHFPARVFLWFA